MDQIGKEFGVSKQRIYQVMTKFGIETPIQKQKNFLRDSSPRLYWLNTILVAKGFRREDRIRLLETLELPDNCPIFDVELSYGEHGLRGPQDNSASIDRVDSAKGYEIGNIHIISTRANRIKNDATPEELMKVGEYMISLRKKSLQL